VPHGQHDAKPAISATAYAGTKLYCLVAEAHVCVNDLPRLKAQRHGVKPARPAPWPLRHRDTRSHNWR